MKFFKKALLINLAVILAIIFALTVFFLTPWGRPAFKTLLLVPEVVPNFPIHPLKTFSKEPVVSEVKLKTAFGEVAADLYRPRDERKHPAVAFTLGTIVTRKDPAVTKFTQALARSGFVVLIPDIPDFLLGFVWTDSVETMKASVEYLEQQPFVDNKKIGFAGFCVGASASIIAAEDDLIKDKVAFISAISPYYNAITLSEAVITETAENENGQFESWKPAQLSVESVQKGFINYLPDEKERELLSDHFINNKEIDQEQLALLSENATYFYAFLANKERSKFAQLLAKIPEDGRDILIQLSPSTKIANLRAKLLILNDKKDTFVPKNEGVKLAQSLPKDKVYLVEVDSFEHVNPKTRLERWAAIKQLFHLGRYIYAVFSAID